MYIFTNIEYFITHTTKEFLQCSSCKYLKFSKTYLSKSQFYAKIIRILKAFDHLWWNKKRHAFIPFTLLFLNMFEIFQNLHKSILFSILRAYPNSNLLSALFWCLQEDKDCKNNAYTSESYFLHFIFSVSGCQNVKVLNL